MPGPGGTPGPDMATQIPVYASRRGRQPRRPGKASKTAITFATLFGIAAVGAGYQVLNPRPSDIGLRENRKPENNYACDQNSVERHIQARGGSLQYALERTSQYGSPRTLAEVMRYAGGIFVLEDVKIDQIIPPLREPDSVGNDYVFPGGGIAGSATVLSVESANRDVNVAPGSRITFTLPISLLAAFENPNREMELVARQADKQSTAAALHDVVPFSTDDTDEFAMRIRDVHGDLQFPDYAVLIANHVDRNTDHRNRDVHVAVDMVPAYNDGGGTVAYTGRYVEADQTGDHRSKYSGLGSAFMGINEFLSQAKRYIPDVLEILPTTAGGSLSAHALAPGAGCQIVDNRDLGRNVAMGAPREQAIAEFGPDGMVAFSTHGPDGTTVSRRSHSVETVDRGVQGRRCGRQAERGQSDSPGLDQCLPGLGLTGPAGSASN
jgi:hypothetical protein